MTVRTARISPAELDHELIWGWVALVSCVFAAWFITGVGLPRIPCPFRTITGLPCLTCGATRAAAALLCGEFRTSLRLHPLVAPGAAFLSVYVPYALLVAHARLPRIRVCLTERDRKTVRTAAMIAAAMLWTFLIADGR